MHGKRCLLPRSVPYQFDFQIWITLQRADILGRHKASTSISELSHLHGVPRATVMRIARPEGALA
jgi:hypothetical protein